MDTQAIEDLKKRIQGEVRNDPETLNIFSHDASIFELRPEVVIAPKTGSDICEVVKFVNENKSKYPGLSVTARSAGTDMSGGVLSESMVLSFTDHLNHIGEITGDQINVEPGVYYRDLEKKTLEKNMLFPAYPASREICAVGGMIGNDCGGEKSLEYGKAENYITQLNMILADGNLYEVRPLDDSGLQEKIKKGDFEGELYNKIYKLIDENYDEIKNAKPKVSKNSSGYLIWDVYDKSTGIFDLTKLFVGSQGTLGIISGATLKLVPVKKHSQMCVIYMTQKEIGKLGEVINVVLATKPESFETYDDNTLKLALKYFSEFTKNLGAKNVLETAVKFLPEFEMKLKGKLPKLILQVEYTGDDETVLKNKINDLLEKLKPFGLAVKPVGNELQSKKYWLIRRQSFSLLKSKIKNMYSSPFIDDFVISPQYLPEFLPKLSTIMAKYPSIISTVAGHIGQGNFHIIPLVDLRNDREVEKMITLQKEVFDLVFQYHGTTSGEHNDGLIRTSFVEPMFGTKIYNLFKDVKKIFDPNNIFNPGKKVDGDFGYALKHVRKIW